MAIKHSPFPAALLELMLFGTIALALFVSQFTSLRDEEWLTVFSIAAGLAVFGTQFLLVAKWPLYREGKFFTLGSHGLSAARKKIYRIGIWLGVVGCGALALTVAQSFLWR